MCKVCDPRCGSRNGFHGRDWLLMWILHLEMEIASYIFAQPPYEALGSAHIYAYSLLYTSFTFLPLPSPQSSLHT